MTKRENLISLLKRNGYNDVPVDMVLCPHLEEIYKTKNNNSDQQYLEYFNSPWRNISDKTLEKNKVVEYSKYYDFQLKKGTNIDIWGVAHEPGSESAKHMTYLRSPMKKFDSIDQIKEYAFPKFREEAVLEQKKEIKMLHQKDLAAVANMQCTIWETSWYMRGMEELMMDMLSDDKMAEVLLDIVTDMACTRAKAHVSAGVDILFLGDDIGMQKSIMMSDALYCDWIKPRLTKVIQAAKSVNPEVIIFYHSCGFIKPFIPHLIEAGIDVLNPIQPESMDFSEIHKEFGDKISFHGTIGTQTTMPFGTPKDVRREVFKNLEIAGSKGGLFCAPSHILEPEVPWDNILAYVNACQDWVK